MTSIRSVNGKVKMSRLSQIITVSLLAVCGWMLNNQTVSAQVIPTPFFCSFSDSGNTINGLPTPVGSKIRAFDPQGVFCGEWTVNVAGNYGFMPVYGDDNNTVGLDEGATEADAILFKVNGITATTTGNTSWSNQALRTVRLATTQSVSWNVLTTFTSLPGTFDDTVRFSMELNNTGNGTDFFDVSATPDNPNFIKLPQTDNFYVDAGQNVTLYFDIETPTFAGGDTVITIDWKIRSKVDTTKFLDGQVDLFFTVTDIDENDQNVPNGFALNQNYPNPFNPTTTIGYALSQTSEVTLEVYNVIGQLVSRTELGRQEAGEHAVDFDGASLSSGVYLYRISAGTVSQMKKMVLLK